MANAPLAPIANSAEEWSEQMAMMAQKRTPSFFHIRGYLPKVGRTNQVLGATTHMNVVLKTYASGGENEMHAHTNEDHLFVVLQGCAVFFGPGDHEREVGKNDCVLIPSGSLYRFQASGNEPLVLLRVGATLDVDTDVLARVDEDGKPFDGYSVRNKEIDYVLDDSRLFE